MSARIFISYAREDAHAAQRLYEDLEKAGQRPWLDTKCLKPGERWKESIRRAVRESEYFIALISSNSVGKTGFVQRELKMAVEVLENHPSDSIFLIPVRLDESRPKDAILRDLSWVDLHVDYESQFLRILELLADSGYLSKIPRGYQAPATVKKKDRNSAQPEAGGIEARLRNDSVSGSTSLRAVLWYVFIVTLLGVSVFFIVQATWMARSGNSPTAGLPGPSDIVSPVGIYAEFELGADLSDLEESDRKLVELLLDAAKEMDEAFWIQAFGDRQSLLALVDSESRHLININYGPWDRLGGNKPIIPGFTAKPLGANFYPEDITVKELEDAFKEQPLVKSAYAMVRRDLGGKIVAYPYNDFFSENYLRASRKLTAAAELASDERFRDYLNLRSEDLLNGGDYYKSDVAWLKAAGHWVDIIIGPIEEYEDRLWGVKAANEAFLLLRNPEQSGRIARYVSMLPELQEALPVSENLKADTPGLRSRLEVYDALYYAGDCNAGPKTMAVTLPNNPDIQGDYGSRRILFWNVMKAKFHKILVPISNQMLVPEGRDLVSFEAFFLNTLFHEIAHGLGRKTTIDGASFGEAMGDQKQVLEEFKADVVGLYIADILLERGYISHLSYENFVVTSFVSALRLIRFGTANQHAVANQIRVNLLLAENAIIKDGETGGYHVDSDSTRTAIKEMARRILEIQGYGDYQQGLSFRSRYETQPASLSEDLRRLRVAGVPVDLVFRQGKKQLGLETAWPRCIGIK